MEIKPKIDSVSQREELFIGSWKIRNLFLPPISFAESHLNLGIWIWSRQRTMLRERNQPLFLMIRVRVTHLEFWKSERITSLSQGICQMLKLSEAKKLSWTFLRGRAESLVVFHTCGDKPRLTGNFLGPYPRNGGWIGLNLTKILTDCTRKQD